MRMPGHNLRQLIAFAPAANYTPRFHYRDHVAEVARKEWAKAFRRRLTEAVATAR
jgi:hypothetical protein